MSRSSNVMMIGYAIGIWLLFTAVSNFLGQLGTAGKLPIFLAAWLPILIFAMIGTFLLTRVRT
jgi:lipopolysaccharide export LptBFGC system permease protein LptF